MSDGLPHHGPYTIVPLDEPEPGAETEPEMLPVPGQGATHSVAHQI